MILLTKRTIKARDLLADIRGGNGLSDLTKKYQVSKEKLCDLLKRCVEAALFDQSEIDRLFSPDRPSPTPDNVAMFRSNPGRTGVYETKGLHKLQGLKWKLNTGAAIDSSPAVADGVVCVGCNNGYMYAVDAENGTEIWRFKAGISSASSPVISDGLCLFGSEKHVLYALDIRSGLEKWRFDSVHFYLDLSPAVADGAVYAGNSLTEEDLATYAIDCKTAKLKWKFMRRTKKKQGLLTHCCPAVADGVVCVPGHDGFMYAIDAETGRENWRFDEETIGDENGTVPAHPIYNGTVYLTIGRNLCGVNLLTGKRMWDFKIRSGYHSDLAVLDEVVYFGAGKNFLYAMDTLTRKEKWKFKVGKLAGPPSIADRAIYMGSYDGNLYALNIETGREKWRFQTGGVVRCSPAIADGVVYFGSNDGYLYALH